MVRRTPPLLLIIIPTLAVLGLSYVDMVRDLENVEGAMFAFSLALLVALVFAPWVFLISKRKWGKLFVSVLL